VRGVVWLAWVLCNGVSLDLATGSATLIGVAVAVPVALLVCAAVVAAFFIYKRMKNPYWMVPEGLLNNLNAGVAGACVCARASGVKMSLSGVSCVRA
jgi:hypothetical protein